MVKESQKLSEVDSVSLPSSELAWQSSVGGVGAASVQEKSDDYQTLNVHSASNQRSRDKSETTNNEKYSYDNKNGSVDKKGKDSSITKDSIEAPDSVNVTVTASQPMSKTHSAIAACLSTPVKAKLVSQRSVQHVAVEIGGIKRTQQGGVVHHGADLVNKPVKKITRSKSFHSHQQQPLNIDILNTVLSSDDSGLRPDLPDILLHSDAERRWFKPGHSLTQTASSAVKIPVPTFKPSLVSPGSLSSFQANLIANLHNLSSPPNQQVFPPEFPDSSLPLTYTHGAISSKSSLTTQCVSPDTSVQPSDVPLFTETSNTTNVEMADLALLRERLKEYRSIAKNSDKNKLESVYDSDGPPPNVDVSVLKDKGHGPIPKDKIMFGVPLPGSYSMTDCSTGVVLSTSSSPMPDIDLKGSDLESGSKMIRSDSACSDRLPISSLALSSELDISMLEDSSSAMSGPTLLSSAIIAPPNAGTINKLSSMCELPVSVKLHMSSDERVSAPIASAPPTPTTVVHHTPTPLTCHQLSLNKARQQAKSQHKPATNNTLDLLHDTSILSPLAAILSNPTICNAFKQMFPEVMQEAVLQSIASLNSAPNPKAASQVFLPGVKAGKQPHALSNPLPGVSAISTVPLTAVGPKSDPSVAIRKQLSGQDTSVIPPVEFPASSLLSAAAKNQFLQQQNYLRMLINQQLPANQQIPVITSQAFVNQQDQTGGSLLVPGQNVSSRPQILADGLQQSMDLQTALSKPAAMGPSLLVQGSIPSVHVASSSVTGAQNSESGKGASKGNSKISELLNRAAPSQHKNVVGQGLVQQQKQLFLQQFVPTQSLASSLNMSTPLQTSIMSPNQQTSTLLTNPAVQKTQTGPALNPLLMSPNAVQMNSSIAMTQLMPTLQNSLSGKLNLNNPVDLMQLQNLQQQQQQQQGKIGPPFPYMTNTNQQQLHNNSGQPLLNVQNVQHLLPNFSLPGINQAIFHATQSQPSAVESLQGNMQQVPNTSTLRVTVPQFVLGNQAITSTEIRAPSQNYGQVAQSQNLANVMLQGSHQINQLGNQSLPMSINNLHLQGTQSVAQNLGSQNIAGGGTTNLTTMQLQALQLQHQLLQQLQQVQGMQHLINQFNLQGFQAGRVDGPGKDVQLTNATVANAGQHIVSSPVQPASVAVHVSSSLPMATNASIQPAIVDVNIAQKPADECPQVVTTTSVQKPSRIIAAADTTEGYARTCDIGTETEMVDDDEDEDEEDNDEDNDDGSEGEDNADDSEEEGERNEAEDNYENEDYEQDKSPSDDVEYEDKGIDGLETDLKADVLGSDTNCDTDDPERKMTDIDEDNVEQTIENDADSKTSEHSFKKDFFDSLKRNEKAIVSEGFTDLKELYKPSTNVGKEITMVGTELMADKKVKPVTTCLAIATEKGNRSRKQKSSLAKSQNLSAELSTPAEGELKLKIKKKHTLPLGVLDMIPNKRKRQKKMFGHRQNFERKELRSSTQAATKASSMLAAIGTEGKSETREVIQACQEQTTVTVPEASEKQRKPFVSKNTVIKPVVEAAIECDSSLSSHVESNIEQETPVPQFPSEQKDVKSQIAAALSNQKGRWHLSSPKKEQTTTEKLDTGCLPISKGVKRSRDSMEVNTKCTNGTLFTICI